MFFRSGLWKVSKKFQYFNMAKDPAFLFYTGDFSTGTQFFSNEQVGKYIRALMAQHQHGRLTEKQLNFIIDKDEDIIKKFKQDESGLFYNERLESESNKRKAFSESRSKSRTKSDEDNVRIYIVRDNVRLTYKIGSSTNPLRRYNELCNKSNTTILENGDITLIWYSDPILRIEESNLHNKFKSKRLSGEWFMLEDEDLTFIYDSFSGKKMEHNERTYFRTNDRTEDENENKDKDIIKNTTKKAKSEKKFIPPTFEEFKIYFSEKGFSGIAQKVFDYYSTADWKDANGNQVKNWKQKVQGNWFRDENKDKSAQTFKPVY